MRRLAEETYGKIAARPEAVRAPRPSEPPAVGPRTITVRDEKVREPQMQRAYVVPSAVTAEPGEAEALSLLAEILGGGATSRFYDQLVRGEGAGDLCRRQLPVERPRRHALRRLRPAEAGHRAPRPRSGAWTRSSPTSSRTASPRRSWRAPSARPIAQAIYSLDNQATLANIVGQALTIGRTLDDVQNWPARIQAVTAAEVQAVAREISCGRRPSATGYLEPLEEGRS